MRNACNVANALLQSWEMSANWVGPGPGALTLQAFVQSPARAVVCVGCCYRGLADAQPSGGG